MAYHIYWFSETLQDGSHLSGNGIYCSMINITSPIFIMEQYIPLPLKCEPSCRIYRSICIHINANRGGNSIYTNTNFTHGNVLKLNIWIILKYLLSWISHFLNQKLNWKIDLNFYPILLIHSHRYNWDWFACNSYWHIHF